MGFARAVLLGFAVLSVLYVLISLYFRSLERERLEDDWAEENPGVEGEDRDAYIEAGMKAYHRSLRRKLILGVYVVPVVAIAAVAYLMNSQ